LQEGRKCKVDCFTHIICKLTLKSGKKISVVLDQELIWHLDLEINKLSKWEKKPETIGNLVSI
jgi:hypothetical protein